MDEILLKFLIIVKKTNKKAKTLQSNKFSNNDVFTKKVDTIFTSEYVESIFACYSSDIAEIYVFNDKIKRYRESIKIAEEYKSKTSGQRA